MTDLSGCDLQVLQAAGTYLTPEALDAVKAAAAIIGMNNVYCRFLHLTSIEKYCTMRAGLRMNLMRTHGIDHPDFELWAAAVSQSTIAERALTRMKNRCVRRVSARRKLWPQCALHRSFTRSP